MKTLNLRKFIAIVLTVSVIASTQAIAFASVPQVVSAPGSTAVPATFKQGIEQAVVKAFDGLAAEVAPEVVAAITPEVEKISAELIKSVADLEMQKNQIETKGFVIDSSAYPPAEVINSIPDQALSQVRQEVQAKISASIAEDFAKSEVEIQAQVKVLMQEATPVIIAELEPALKALVPKVHGIIEQKIEERIEAEIIKVLPDLMPLIPADMANMSPEEIAAKMKAEIKPSVESAVRPEFEAIIKDQVDDLMVEKIKAPMVEKFQPKMAQLDASVYDKYIDELPSYLERVVSKEYIKSVVSSNIKALQAKLPSMVESSRAEMDAKIESYVKATIENEAKIYIGQSYVKAPISPQLVSNRMLVPFRAIATALGAEVEWRYKERQVVMKKAGTEIVLTIDSDVVLVNGKPANLDVAAKIYQGNTIVPLRFIAETFNMDVDWQKDWKMVTIENK